MNYIVLDTETTNGYIKDGRLCLDDSLVYDLGYAVVNENREVLLTRSFVIREIFCNKSLMEVAFFKDKIPQYWKDIKNGSRKLVNFYIARKTLIDDMVAYDCNILSAHNAPFDCRALNNTQRYLTKSKYRWFFKYGCEIIDTLPMARETICTTDDYIKFCEENNYLTNHKKPQVRATAEILHRYLSGNNDFIESHTGLEDVLIEKDILIECLRMLSTE